MRGQPFVTVDIGGTWIRVAIARDDHLGPVRRARTPSADREALLDSLLGLVRATLRDEPRSAGVAVSVTGPVDPASGRLYAPPNTGEGLAGLPLGECLTAAFGLPVRVDRDTNCALLGEARTGAARGRRNVVFATFSTGVGGAILLDGRLLRGRDGVGGELGHTVVDPAGAECGCGRRGCLEAIASGPAIARACGQQTGEQASALAATGDRAAQRALGRARRGLVNACVDWANVFNPELVVVGGSVALANPEWVQAASRAVARDGLQPASAHCEVVLTRLGDDVALVGAPSLFREEP